MIETDIWKGIKMELNYFKDKIFELLNESDYMNISDIETNDRNNTFTVTFQDGKCFEVECRELHNQSGSSMQWGKKNYPLARVMFQQKL